MSEIKSTIAVQMAGNLVSMAQRYTQSMRSFSRSSIQSLRSLRGAANLAGATLDKVGNRYTALLTGAAGVGTAKKVMDIGQRYTRLGIQANVAADTIDGLKQKIYQAAQSPDIRVDPGLIVSAIEEIVEKTGDLKFAEANLRGIGLAIQATGADGQAIGGIMAEFQKMGIIDPKQVMEAMDILTVQGKEGAFTLQNLAALGPRVVTAYTATGRGGVQAIREMGAALQVIRQGTGSSEMAATAFEAVMNTLGDGAKIKKLYAGGIQVFDPEALKEGKEVLRPINELMVEIIQKAQGKKTILSQIFDTEAIRAFNAANAEFLKTGDVTVFDKFMKLQADGATITKDSARAAQTAAAAWTSLGTAFEKFADENLTKRLQGIADVMGSISPEKMDTTLKWVTRGGLAVGGLVAARKVQQYGSWALGLLRGGKGKGGLAGGLLSGAGLGKPIPVIVVNPDFGAGIGESVGKSLKDPKSLLKSLTARGKALSGTLKGSAGAAGLGTTAAAATAAGVAGYAAGSWFNRWNNERIMAATGGASKDLGELLYNSSHDDSGMESEKTVALRASILQKQSLQRLAELLHQQKGYGNTHEAMVISRAIDLKRQEAKVGGTIKVEIESKEPVRVKELKTENRDVNLEVDTGRVMAGS